MDFGDLSPLYKYRMRTCIIPLEIGSDIRNDRKTKQYNWLTEKAARRILKMEFISL